MTAINAELIVLAVPMPRDTYYTKVKQNIFNFQISFAKKIIKNGDQVLILSPPQSYDAYVKQLGKNHVLIASMLDIWARDYALVNPDNPVMFRYTAAAQGGGKKGQIEAEQVQNVFYALAKQAGLLFKESDLLNDGGNFVSDDAGNVIVSTKFLQDNHLSENVARKKLPLRAMESCKRRRVVRDSARFFNQPAGMLKNLYVRVASLENAVRSYPEVTELRLTRTVAAN